MTAHHNGEMFDSAIIGGGPAGLSAAIYLGRFLRRTILLDGGGGRTSWNQKNDNYFGFPNGIRSGELVKRGQKQADRFGVVRLEERVESIVHEGDEFHLSLHDSSLRARTLILATGVTDVWPDFPNARRYVGHSLFWCLTCDGFKAQNKRVIVMGNGNEAATTALQMLNYSSRVEFLCPELQSDISSEKRVLMKERGIAWHQGRICRARGKGTQLHAVYLEDGTCLELDCLFSMLGQVPNSQLAATLGVMLVERGCIKVDAEGATNVPGIFACGDATNQPAQQVASAVHQGALAGASANYFLYDDAQKTAEMAAKPSG